MIMNREQKLEYALLLMVNQYCGKVLDGKKFLTHNCMSAGEIAFDALGIDDFSDAEGAWQRIKEMEKLRYE